MLNIASLQSVSWLPIDVAASSIIEIALTQTEPLPSILHCAHPYPTPWKSVISSFREALASRTKDDKSISILPFSEWVEHVNELVASCEGVADETVTRFPSTKIQNAIGEMARVDKELRRIHQENLDDGIEEVEAGGTRRLLTTKMECLSSSLRSVKPLYAEDVRRWVGYWVEKGLFV